VIDFGSVLLILLFYFGLFILMQDASSSNRQSRRHAWNKLAARAGLTFVPGSFWRTPTVTGTYRGHALTLDTFTRSSRHSAARDNRIILFINNRANLYLALYEKTFVSKIGKFLGMRDIQIGDDEFERRFMIKGHPENGVTRLLGDSKLRARIMAARSFNVEVIGQELHFEERYCNLDLDYTQSLFDLLTDIAIGVEQIEAQMFSHV
jgi:hypothetical protein